MKIINHNKNNSYDINTYIMRGTIKMTQKEWNDSYIYLMSQYKKAIKDIETYKRDNLASLKKDNGIIFSIGITATKLITKKYNLTGYKQQNYGILIVA